MTMTASHLWHRITARADSDRCRIACTEQKTGRSLTYRDLVDRSHALAGRDDASPLILPSGNTIDFAPLFFGALLAGRSVLPISPDAPAAELDRVRSALKSLDRSQPASLLLTTSGTTGSPKIVRRTIESLDAVAAAMVAAIGFTAADRVIAAVPLVHSYGLEHGLLAPLWAGSTTILCEGLDLPQLIAALTDGATILPTVPSAIELLTQVSDSIRTPALRRVYTAGAPLPRSVARAFAARFNLQVGQVYGSTEVGSVIYNDPARDTPASVGRAMPGVSIRILGSDAARRPLTANTEGEVAIFAPSMLAGYVGDAAGFIDGHFPTGDIGRLSAAGELTLTGRVRLLIDVGGAKVNPLEVERVLEAHPAVAACVVLPLRLSETVQKIRAIIVPADPTDPPSPVALRAYAREHLSAYKVPRVIDFRSSLPRTAAGKIARQQLELSEQTA